MTLPELVELLDAASADIVIVTTMVCMSLALLAGGMLRHMQRRTRRVLEERVVRLERTLTLYAETATSVAQTLDQLLLDRVPPGQRVHSSRRYLLRQARARLAEGEPLTSIARGLGLSRDEVRLLGRLHPAEILVREAEQRLAEAVSESAPGSAAA